MTEDIVDILRANGWKVVEGKEAVLAKITEMARNGSRKPVERFNSDLATTLPDTPQKRTSEA